ncbi:hypothetical protein EMN47_07970 [Prolixibacteraceae bacterium JC049]|nr:hypothetical protein [Prolixibacteraceae bacterium JC049]
MFFNEEHCKCRWYLL